MELTPELLIEAKFSRARHGYDMAEVDDFLERCAEGLEVLLTRLTAEFERAEAAEAMLAARPEVPVDATVIAPQPPTPAPTPTQERPPEPEPVAAPSPAGGVSEESMRVLVMAERTAEAAVSEARAEAQRIRNEAESVAQSQRTKAETMVARARAEAEAEARRVGDEVKRGIEVEVVELRRDRDGLTEDIRNLRRWLDEQRARMRTTARDLQRLVEDPAALREFPLPTDAPGVGGPGVGGMAEPAQVAPEPAPAPAAQAPVDEAGADDGAPTQAVPTVDFGAENDPFEGSPGSFGP